MCLVLGSKGMSTNASVVLKFNQRISHVFFRYMMLLAVTNILHAVIVVRHFLSESNNGKFGSLVQ